MANPLPTLRGSSTQALYPLTRTISFLTRIQKFANATEQRWPVRPPLARFQLSMSSLSAADKASWLSFFNTQKGRFNQDLALTLKLNGSDVLYSNLALDSDSLAVTNARPLEYDQQIVLRQVRNSSWTPPTPGTNFPTLSSGVACQLPVQQSSDFWSNVYDQGSGPRYVWGFYAEGLSGFPTGYLRSWRLSYPVLSDADLATLEAFFMTQQGCYSSFTFTDPLSGSSYDHVRFDTDELAIQHQDYNRASVTLLLVQTNNS